jgi:hydroxymethylpyrimidine/phosphomethylpyrimidine kinase
MTPPVALTIAGSDSGGGAGIQADLKTFAALRVFGTSAITAVTAQNTRGVVGFVALAAGFVDEQIGAVLSDLPVRATKTGMLASGEIVAAVTERAAAGELPNLVVDPVLVAASGDPLALGGVAEAYPKLFAHATVVTPNLREASLLLGRTLSTLDEMAVGAAELADGGPGCVVIKGGHLPGDRTGGEAVDVVWCDGEVSQLRAPWVDTANNHGTGCTFASAITAGLATGRPLPEALRHAKEYVTGALVGAAGWRLGGGHGPLNHFNWEV